LWIELLFVVGTIAVAFVFFSRAVRRRIGFLVPLARRLRLEAPGRAVYVGLHGYREHPGTLLTVAVVTTAAQLTRVLAIYASGRDAARGCSMEPSRPDVSVVVVTYDALPWLEQCLASVRGHELIVVDHGSTDGTLELVRTRFPDVRIVEQENKGMGGGNNAGM